MRKMNGLFFGFILVLSMIIVPSVFALEAKITFDGSSGVFEIEGINSVGNVNSYFEEACVRGRTNNCRLIERTYLLMDQGSADNLSLVLQYDSRERNRLYSSVDIIGVDYGNGFGEFRRASYVLNAVGSRIFQRYYQNSEFLIKNTYFERDDLTQEVFYDRENRERTSENVDGKSLVIELMTRDGKIVPYIEEESCVGSDCVQVEWVRTFDSGGDDVAYDVEVDLNGNVYVAGDPSSLVVANYLVYDSNGNQFYSNAFAPDGSIDSNPIAKAIVRDQLNNTYVAGSYTNGSGQQVALLVKKSYTGAEVWSISYNQLYLNSFNDVDVDSSGNVYVTGSSHEDYLTIKYDSNGNQIWKKTHASNSTDQALGVDTDSSGNVYVTGSFNNKFHTIKYDSNGNELWTKSSQDLGASSGVDTDSSGNVYITGYIFDGSSYKYLTIKYDSNGNELWNVSYSNEYPSLASSVDTDSSGNVYVTGTSFIDSRNRYLTIKYDSNGNQIWKVFEDSNYSSSRALSIDVDSSGNVYVTGSSSNGDNSDYLTIKYSQLD